MTEREKKIAIVGANAHFFSSMISDQIMKLKCIVRLFPRPSPATGYGLVFGRNTNTSVTDKYEASIEFNGKIDKVTIELR